jgi:hypothetical protein
MFKGGLHQGWAGGVSSKAKMRSYKSDRILGRKVMKKIKRKTYSTLRTHRTVHKRSEFGIRQLRASVSLSVK